MKPINFLVRDYLLRKILYQRMYRISAIAEWISINSAVGGVCNLQKQAFPRRKLWESTGRFASRERACCITQTDVSKRVKIYVNPGLINANWNTYNINRYLLVRHLRELTRSNPFFFRLKILSKLEHLLKSHKLSLMIKIFYRSANFGECTHTFDFPVRHVDKKVRVLYS
jgi:hypothetical protein